MKHKKYSKVAFKKAQEAGISTARSFFKDSKHSEFRGPSFCWDTHGINAGKIAAISIWCNNYYKTTTAHRMMKSVATAAARKEWNILLMQHRAYGFIDPMSIRKLTSIATARQKALDVIQSTSLSKVNLDHIKQQAIGRFTATLKSLENGEFAMLMAKRHKKQITQQVIAQYRSSVKTRA